MNLDKKIKEVILKIMWNFNKNFKLTYAFWYVNVTRKDVESI